MTIELGKSCQMQIGIALTRDREERASSNYLVIWGKVQMKMLKITAHVVNRKCPLGLLYERKM